MADDEEDSERRNLSPDSSTQHFSNVKQKRGKSKKHKHKSRKHKRRRSEGTNSGDEGTDRKSLNSSKDSNMISDHEQPDIMDVDNFVLPKSLTEFIDDRKALNEELFEIFTKKEIKKLLPKLIRKMPLEELKARCLDQLEVISKKRLLRIINGDVMSSSSSESEHEVTQSSRCDATVGDLKTQPSNTEPPEFVKTPETQVEHVNIMEELSLVPDQDEIDELIEGAVDNKQTTAVVEPVVDDKSEVELPDTQSQLLELEYRARALKSMVIAQQSVQ